MEKERNTEGWSARQLIRHLQRRSDAVGSRQSSVGSPQSSVGSPQSSVSSPQSSVGSSQSAVGSFQSTVGSPQSSGESAGKKTRGKKGKGGILKGLISGTIISESLILKDIRYTALVASLAIIFIANKFNAERVERQIIVLEQEVRDMRAESLSVSAELGSVSRQSEITELVKIRGLGLEELREPPFRIVVNE
ncbi:MAG: FtsL-like putative cell division protein [Bacteroidales bacterium]